MQRPARPPGAARRPLTLLEIGCKSTALLMSSLSDVGGHPETAEVAVAAEFQRNGVTWAQAVPRALVLAPTRELVQQIEADLGQKQMADLRSRGLDSHAEYDG